MPATHAVPGAVVATLGTGTNIIGKVYITDGTDDVEVSATGGLSVLDENSAAIKTAVQLIDDVVATDGAADLTKLLQVGGTDGTNAQILSTDNTGKLNVIATQGTAANLKCEEASASAIKDAVELIDDTVGADGVAEVAKILQVGGSDGTNNKILLTDNTGKLLVIAAQTTAANLNCTEASASNIKTAVELIDDTVFAEDVGHTDADKGIHVLSVRKDTAAALCGSDLDYAPLITDSTGRLHVTLSDTITVSATDLDIRNLAPATDSVKINDGSTDLAVAVEDSAAKTAGLQAMGRYDATIPTAVGDGDATLLLTDAYGAVQTTGHVANAFRAAQNQSSAQTNTELVATPGAGLSLYVTDIIISNGATAGNVKLVESTASSPVDILEVMYFAINGGCVINLQTPLKLTANKNLGYTSVACTTHSVTVAGYTAP